MNEEDVKRLNYLAEYSMSEPTMYKNYVDDDAMMPRETLSLEDVLNEDDPEQVQKLPQQQQEPAQQPQKQEPVPQAQPEQQPDNIEELLKMVQGLVASMGEIGAKVDTVSNKIAKVESDIEEIKPETEDEFEDKMVQLSGKGSETPKDYFSQKNFGNVVSKDLGFNGNKYYTVYDPTYSDNNIKDTLFNNTNDGIWK